jgi:putative flippase GtrA
MPFLSGGVGKERCLLKSDISSATRLADTVDISRETYRRKGGSQIDTLLSRLPLRWLGAARVELLSQFLQFGLVGVIAFLVDASVVYALRASVGLYVAGAVSYLVAVTVAWWLNRSWTFNGNARPAGLHLEWARYAVANIPGLLLNRGAYFALVALSSLCASHPVLAVAAGAVSGMFANFTLSRALVFR